MSSDTDYKQLFRRQKDESLRLAGLLTECRQVIKKIMDENQYKQFDETMRFKENQTRKIANKQVLEA